MTTSHHHDRPQLPEDAWVRDLFKVAPPSIPAPQKPLPKKVKP